MTDAELAYSTHEEQVYWLEAVRGLPGLEGFLKTGYSANGERIPYGTGPHNLKGFKRAIELFQPKNIYETGTNLGYSAAVILSLCDAKMTSIDISNKAETINATEVLKDRYHDRFRFFCVDGRNAYDLVKDQQYDVAYIDGDHSDAGITADIETCIKLGIKNFIFDDFLPQFSDTQISVKKFPQLEMVELIGNTAIMKIK